MSGKITSLTDAIGLIVNKLVHNEGASIPFLLAVVGLNGSLRYSRVELIAHQRGQCSTIAETLVDGGFTFPVNIMCIGGAGTGHLAVIGAEHLFVLAKKGEYVVGANHTNTIEGFWSLVICSMVGTFRRISKNTSCSISRSSYSGTTIWETRISSTPR